MNLPLLAKFKAQFIGNSRRDTMVETACENNDSDSNTNYCWERYGGCSLADDPNYEYYQGFV
jgi:hypothetical protein